jgi:hypothetical protein
MTTDAAHQLRDALAAFRTATEPLDRVVAQIRETIQPALARLAEAGRDLKNDPFLQDCWTVSTGTVEQQLEAARRLIKYKALSFDPLGFTRGKTARLRDLKGWKSALEYHVREHADLLSMDRSAVEEMVRRRALAAALRDSLDDLTISDIRLQQPLTKAVAKRYQEHYLGTLTGDEKFHPSKTAYRNIEDTILEGDLEARDGSQDRENDLLDLYAGHPDADLFAGQLLALEHLEEERLNEEVYKLARSSYGLTDYLDQVSELKAYGCTNAEIGEELPDPKTGKPRSSATIRKALERAREALRSAYSAYDDLT